MSSLPTTFITRMENLLGDAATAFLKSQEDEVPVSIRMHPCKGKGLFKGEPEVPWTVYGRYLKTRPVFTLDPLFHAGCYYVQEAGSMLIESLLGNLLNSIPTPKVLDLCAAPGGKSTHILSLMPGDGLLVSNELIPGRNKILRHNLSKWGHPNVIVTQNEARDIAASGEKFDLILVDAPCSGEGLFRKDPEAIHEWSPEQVNRCAIRQQTILQDTLPLLAEGGYLLYSTCTYEPEENDNQIEKLLTEFPFVNVTPEAPHEITATKHGWQAYPHLTLSEGFYCCLLRFEGKQHQKEKRKSPQKNKISLPTADWLIEADRFELFQQGEYINAATTTVISSTIALGTSCYIRQSGIPMGALKGTDFIPSPELALSTSLKSPTPVLELTRNDAICFLRCESLKAEVAQEGWHLIKYNGQSLGWAKKIKQRWNNYYPKEWRILMENAAGIK